MKTTSSVETLASLKEYGKLENVDDKLRLYIENGFKENVSDPEDKFITDEINEVLKTKIEKTGLVYEDQRVYNNGNGTQNKVLQIGHSYLTFDPRYSKLALKVCKFLYNIKEVN